MSRLHPPRPARLVVGLLMKDKELLAPAADALTQRLGPVDMAGEWLDFDYTDYYTPEMGAPLYRRMLSFRKLIHQADLSEIKHATHSLEQRFAEGGKRRVNIDPGYLLPERFVLATGKNYTHRIYLGRCVYADLTLTYRKGDFVDLPWTYPDYASEPVKAFLRDVRLKYMLDLKRHAGDNFSSEKGTRKDIQS